MDQQSNNRSSHLSDQELEALLQSLQQGQTQPGQPVHEAADADFAAKLVALSKRAQVDPAFESSLRARLHQAARAHKATPQANNGRARSMLSHLLNARFNGAVGHSPQPTSDDRRQYPMKRMIVALTSAVTLIALIILAASLPLGNPATNTNGQNTAGQTGSGQDAAGATTPTPVGLVEPVPAPVNPGPSAFGISEFVLADNLGGLPTAPGRTMPLYKQQPAASSTVADARRYAQMFGMQPNIYQLQMAASVEAGLTVIDGPRRLMVQNGWLFYSDASVRNALNATATLPYTHALQVAESFLKGLGLLSGEYRAEPPVELAGKPTFGSVRFMPLAGGIPLAGNGGLMGIIVSVADDERIASIVYHMPVLEPAGEASVIDVKEAWQTLTQGQMLRFSSSGMYGQGTDPRQHAASQQRPRTWEPEYQPGARVDLYGAPMIYMPVEGNRNALVYMGNVRLEDNQFILAGTQLTQPEQLVAHVWGQMRQEISGELVLTVEGADAVQAGAGTYNGTIKREQDRTLLLRDDAPPLVLPNTPASLPDGIAVTVFGWQGEAQNGDTVLHWTVIQSPPEGTAQGTSQTSTVSMQNIGVIQAISVPAAPPSTVTPAMPAPTAVPEGQPTAPPPPTAAPLPTEAAIDSRMQTPTALPPPKQMSFPFADGQRVEGLEGSIDVFITEDEDGSNREVQVFLYDQSLDSQEIPWRATLTGNQLTGIEKLYQLRVRVWGSVKFIGPDMAEIAVERLEPVDPNARIQAWLGKVVTRTVEDRSILVLQTNEGAEFILAHSIRYPDTTLVEAGTVIVEGVLRPEKFGGYAVIEQMIMTTAPDNTDLSTYQIMTKAPRQVRVTPSKGIIEQVELVYLVDEVMIGRNPDGNVVTPEPARLMVRPVWRFAGHTERGGSFEALVEALPASELERLGLSQPQIMMPTMVPLPGTQSSDGAATVPTPQP